MDRPLITATVLATHLAGRISPTDPRLQAAAEGASAAIRAYCNWHVAPVAKQTLILDGPGGVELDLPTMRVSSIMRIHNNNRLISPQDYSWSQLGNVRLHGGVWTTRYRGVTVTLTHGLPQAPDVIQVGLAVAARHLANPTGVVREQAGQVAVQYTAGTGDASGGFGLLGSEEQILNNYRITTP